MCMTRKASIVVSANSDGTTPYSSDKAPSGAAPDQGWKLVALTFLAFYLGIFAGSAQAADGNFDGKWRVSIEYSQISSSDPKCRGFLQPDPMIITNGKISGIINHTIHGACFLKGSVTADGALKNAKCESGTTYAMKGQMGSDVANGTWADDEAQCDGTWKAKKIK